MTDMIVTVTVPGDVCEQVLHYYRERKNSEKDEYAG